MPNWVYNRLTVSGDSTDIKFFAKSIGSKGLVIDFPKLSTIVIRTWDARDEGLARLEKIKDGLIYFFDTAWTPPRDMMALNRMKTLCLCKNKFKLVFV